MCVQCDNADFEIDLMDSVAVDGENYSVITNDIKDSLGMILSGVTFGDNYAATVVIHTGELVINTEDEYRSALASGALNPEVNQSMTHTYKGAGSYEDVRDRHQDFIDGLKAGLIPKWQSIEDQRNSVMSRVDSGLDFLIGDMDDIN